SCVRHAIAWTRVAATPRAQTWTRLAEEGGIMVPDTPELPGATGGMAPVNTPTVTAPAARPAAKTNPSRARDPRIDRRCGREGPASPAVARDWRTFTTPSF